MYARLYRQSGGDSSTERDVLEPMRTKLRDRLCRARAHGDHSEGSPHPTQDDLSRRGVGVAVARGSEDVGARDDLVSLGSRADAGCRVNGTPLVTGLSASMASLPFGV